ncbi:hypothetical protein RHMOL_Rhmol08G0139700 [Rhododendron molle]|uniref:Uncharacterized protein n=1 Tax=Rhododendron molle TaxID=49168 RepID=A0ACC0MNC0_RHOML|nr:hypothetical protein RHMOL_Rhmol08G0139700 [Rhododendron molle]
MGKSEKHRLHLQQQQQTLQPNTRSQTGSTILCERCSVALRRIGREFNLKCLVVLIFSLSVFLSAVFWILPLRSTAPGFDAKYAIQLAATVQGSFRLQKSVSMLIPQIGRLEYDIYSEIGVPYTKVAILSMHQADESDWTNVVFGVLSDPVDVVINPVSLSVLRSSLIELFLQQSNLTLTNSIFGEPSSLEILKSPGGITVIPDQSASIWQISQTLFNFTLRNSICEVIENLSDLKKQLKSGLRLRSYENIYVQLTNRNGSTRDPPVTVQAAVMSNFGSLLPQRLKQLAQTIEGSPPSNNLGLNNTVFGKVKEVRLSSFLNCTILATSPTPSPAPAPENNDYYDSPISPSYSPTPGPNFQRHLPPCVNCDASSPSTDDKYPYSPSPESYPHRSLPPISSSPAPSISRNQPPRSSPHHGSTIPPRPSAFPPHSPHSYPPHAGPTPLLSPDLSPLPVVSYGSTPRREKGDAKGPVSPPLVSPSVLPSPSSSNTGPNLNYKEIWLFGFFGLLTFHLLC